VEGRREGGREGWEMEGKERRKTTTDTHTRTHKVVVSRYKRIQQKKTKRNETSNIKQRK